MFMLVSQLHGGVIQAAGRCCGAYSFVCMYVCMFLFFFCFMLLCYFDQMIYCLFLLPSSSSLTVWIDLETRFKSPLKDFLKDIGIGKTIL